MALFLVPVGLLACLAVMISPTDGVLVKGPCPVLESQANFKMAPYLGKWNELESFYNQYEEGTPCTSGTYTLHDDGSIRLYITDRSGKGKNGKIVVPDPSKPAEFLYYYSKPGEHTVPFAYFVADTDYNNYAIEFSCTNLDGNLSLQFAWIMTRTRNKAPDNLSELKQSLQSKGIDYSLFRLVDQSNCD